MRERAFLHERERGYERDGEEDVDEYDAPLADLLVHPEKCHAPERESCATTTPRPESIP